MSMFFWTIGGIMVCCGVFGNEPQIITHGLLWCVMSILTEIKEKIK